MYSFKRVLDIFNVIQEGMRLTNYSSILQSSNAFLWNVPSAFLYTGHIEFSDLH